MAFASSDFLAGAVYDAGTTTWSVPMPATVQAGDWLYLCITSNTDHTLSTINGAAASGSTVGATADGWELIVKNTAASTGFAIWEKKHDGSEANPCVVVFSATEIGVAHIFRVRNAAATTPRGQLAAGTSGTTTSAVTPPADDHAIVAVVYIDPSAATSWTWAVASEMFDSADGANAAMAAAYIIQTTATSQAVAYTPSPAATVGWVRWEMEPAAGGAVVSGAASAEFGFGATVAAKKEAKAATVVPLTAGIAAVAIKNAHAATAVPLVFTVDSTGVVIVSGAAAAEFTFGAAVSAIKNANAASDLPLTIGIAVAATKSVYAATATPLTVDVTTAATKNANAATATPLTFAAVTAVTKNAVATTAVPIVFDIATAGEVAGAVDGAASVELTFGANTAATKTAHAAADLPLSMDVAASVTRTAYGSTAVPITFTIDTAGEVTAGAVTGATSSEFTFGATVAAVKTATATLDVPLVFTIVTTAEADVEPVTLAVIAAGQIVTAHVGDIIPAGVAGIAGQHIGVLEPGRTGGVQ